jgi:hypothetical protein
MNMYLFICERTCIYAFINACIYILGTFNRVFLNYWSDSKENFYGFGSQFTHWNLNGRRIPILCAENGIGRGAQPITSLLNLLGTFIYITYTYMYHVYICMYVHLYTYMYT